MLAVARLCCSWLASMLSRPTFYSFSGGLETGRDAGSASCGGDSEDAKGEEGGEEEDLARRECSPWLESVRWTVVQSSKRDAG